MGKTASGAVWLNADLLSSYDYWQFWRNTEDADTGRVLRLFTELPEAEIVRLEALHGAELNEAKKVLATETTALAHGRAAAEQAAETAKRTFEQGAIDKDLPVIEMDWAGGKNWTERTNEAILKASGLASSLSDARKKIMAGGAVRINGDLLSTDSSTISRRLNDVDPKTGALVVQYGKKKIILVKPV